MTGQCRSMNLVLPAGSSEAARGPLACCVATSAIFAALRAQFIRWHRGCYLP